MRNFLTLFFILFLTETSFGINFLRPAGPEAGLVGNAGLADNGATSGVLINPSIITGSDSKGRLNLSGNLVSRYQYKYLVNGSSQADESNTSQLQISPGLAAGFFRLWNFDVALYSYEHFALPLISSSELGGQNSINGIFVVDGEIRTSEFGLVGSQNVDKQLKLGIGIRYLAAETKLNGEIIDGTQSSIVVFSSKRRAEFVIPTFGMLYIFNDSIRYGLRLDPPIWSFSGNAFSLQAGRISSFPMSLSSDVQQKGSLYPGSINSGVAFVSDQYEFLVDAHYSQSAGQDSPFFLEDGASYNIGMRRYMNSGVGSFGFGTDFANMGKYASIGYRTNQQNPKTYYGLYFSEITASNRQSKISNLGFIYGIEIPF